jgi:hypothetical protein
MTKTRNKQGGKKGGKKKSHFYVQYGGLHICGLSWGFKILSNGPPSREPTHMGTSPTTYDFICQCTLCSLIVFVVSIQVHHLLFNNHFRIVVQNVNAKSTLKWSDYNLVSLAIISFPLFIWEEAIDIWFEYMWPKT